MEQHHARNMLHTDVVAPIVVTVLHVYPTAYMCCNQDEGNIRQCLDL